MNDAKGKILILLCIAIFGLAGAYLTFFFGNTNKYDSKTTAYRIESNESYDGESYSYSPTYYFKVDDEEYECRSKVESSTEPNEKKNTVYYDSKNPKKCMTEYDASSGKLLGIICLIAAAVIIYFFIIRKPKEINDESVNVEEMDTEKERQVEEKVQKAVEIAQKAELVAKRVVIGIIIVILLVLLLIDNAIIRQTITAKDYIETTATYVDYRVTNEDSEFKDCIYTFKDKDGNDQEVIITVARETLPKDEISVKYNEKDPKDYYEEGSIMSKSGIIWYVVKVVALIFFIFLFFNKKLLNMISISASNSD